MLVLVVYLLSDFPHEGDGDNSQEFCTAITTTFKEFRVRAILLIKAAI